MYKSDIEIAQSVKMLPIGEIAEKAGIDDRFIEPYGRYKAKVDYNFLNETKGKDGKLILVTAINPTPAGEGKTTTTIGLADGPMEDINLHFTGDFHAIGAANNLLAAMIDNHIYQGNSLNIDPRQITWRRCVDMNDRQLRFVTDGLGGKANGTPREDGFDITAASEIMAILCLAYDMSDLKRRLADITVGYTYGSPLEGRVEAQSRADFGAHSRLCARRSLCKHRSRLQFHYGDKACHAACRLRRDGGGLRRRFGCGKILRHKMPYGGVKALRGSDSGDSPRFEASRRSCKSGSRRGKS